MSSYQGTISVHRPAREVFDFLTNPDNIPKYVPTMRSARLTADGSVHVEGECPAQHYRGTADFSVDAPLMRIHWSSAANLDYRGWIAVMDRGGSCEVALNLDFEPVSNPAHNESFRRLLRGHSGAIQEALEDALTAIRAECEGTARIEVKRGGAGSRSFVGQASRLI